MNRDPNYSGLELRLLFKIGNELKKGLKNKGIIIENGVYIKPKPKNVRKGFFEINTTGIEGERINRNITGLVNVNYQDTEYIKVVEYAVLISDLLTGRIIKQLLLEDSNMDDRFRIYPNGPNLWVGNVQVEIKHLKAK